jgi:hypothetical protein
VTHGAEGNRFVETTLTVTMTRRRQDRNTLDFLTQSRCRQRSKATLFASYSSNSRSNGRLTP